MLPSFVFSSTHHEVKIASPAVCSQRPNHTQVLDLLLMKAHALLLYYSLSKPRCFSTMATTTTSSSTKCLVYGPTVSLKTKPVPSRIPRNHVLVQVKAAGLNPVDAKNVIGDKFPHAMDGVTARMVRGNTIGFEFSGTVVKSSDDGTNNYKEGDDVFGSMPPLKGTLSEYIVAPLDQIAPMPSTLTYAQAACLPLVGLTALQALSPYSDSSKSILIVGASGGTGHVSLQVAKLLGFTTIVAVCSTRNVDFCKSLGATHVVDYTQYSSGDGFVEQLTAIQDGTFDIVLDCVTSVDPRDAQHGYPAKLTPLCNRKYIRFGGRTVEWFYAGCERVLSVECFRGKEKLFWIRFPKSSDELKLLKSWAEEGALKPSIEQEYEFTPESVEQAFQQILSRRVKGKCVVKLQD